MAENLKIPEMNKVFLVGRVTRDLELRYTASKQAVVSLSLAVNRVYKDAQTGEWKELASFVPIVLWGKTAEIANDRVKKGSAIAVEGRLQSRSWESKQGEKRTTLEVVADRIQFLTKTSSDDNVVDTAEAKVSQKTKDKAWDEAPIEDIDEDIPF